ncbi:DUF1272 domain-containing protein [Marinicella sediminis]|nr:DUF1272 domain-containing protein [Marinicella sediminis]
MKSKCERCDKKLQAEQSDACICSYECTFCTACATGALQGVCPNCQGKLVERPSRVQAG